MRLSRESVFIAVAALAGVALLASVGRRTVNLDWKEPLILPPAHIEHFAFGYNENVSDSLWLRVIQNIDYCDALALAADSSGSGKHTPCASNLGWVYHMLDAITTLTPKFRMPYNHGATVLSVSVGDKEGARRIFEKGIENFPQDWSIQFRAAYHYLYELNDAKRAADLLLQAGKNGAPQWVFGLAARLYTREGQALLAKSVLESVLEENLDPKYSEHLKTRVDQLNEILKEESLKKDADKK